MSTTAAVCRSGLFLLNPEPPSVRIERAIAWYRSNRDRIQAALPLRVPFGECGVSLYVSHWNPQVWIDRWEQKRLGIEEAEAKICEQIRPLYQHFQNLRT